MDKIRTLMALVVFWWVLVSCSRSDPAFPVPLDARSSRIVLIEAFCVGVDPFLADGPAGVPLGMWRGSGVMLGGDRVLTALHVVDCPYMLGAHASDQTLHRWEARVIKTWPDRDLALLAATGLQAAPVAIATASAAQGACSGFAWPSRGWECGVITGVDYGPTCKLGPTGRKWCRDLAWSGTAIGGNSGGPLWDEFGRLIALVTGGSTTPGDVIPLPGAYAAQVAPIARELTRR